MQSPTTRFPFHDLAAHCTGPLLLPGEDAYDTARAVWNAMISRHPAAILRCMSRDDVVAGVRFAADHGLAVSIKGGGHNVARHSVGDGALMLDLSPMRGVTVDPVARTAWVEGGGHLGRGLRRNAGPWPCHTGRVDLGNRGRRADP